MTLTLTLTQVSDESIAFVALQCRELQVLELDWHLHAGLTRASLSPFLGGSLRGLLLWNLRNDTRTLNRIVEHFGPTVTQVGLINAYHRWSLIKTGY